MFKLESYIAPWLLGYIDKYVKLRQEDFQISLWGGDAVLSKLDLRLDVIEQSLDLPITFKSGHIHELRLHVPWTKIGWEPVVITINTMECVVKLKDFGQDSDGDSIKSASSASNSAKPAAAAAAAKTRTKRQQETEDLPPGYLQSLINRIVNNVNIVVNNLILKFVEDDIVLSVNVKSVECYSVNKDWVRDFVELAQPELVLRRIIDLQDLTMCLDKRNASGKIEMYQDPLLYRCSMSCRLHMKYPSVNATLPITTILNIMCEHLDLSLTDTQLPMFCRLLELCVAIYYGTLDLPGASKDMAEPPEQRLSHSSEQNKGVEQIQAIRSQMPGYEMYENEEGWMSWAWSYVPQIMPDDIENGEWTEDGRGRKIPLEPAVFSLGCYCSRASLSFKVSEYTQDGRHYGLGRVTFQPCLRWELQGIAIEALLKGLEFFNFQFGVTHTKIMCQGLDISGHRDLDSPQRKAVFYMSEACTDIGNQTPGLNYLTHSLFDPGGAENLGLSTKHFFSFDQHLEIYSEPHAVRRFGAFWMDYVYTMVKAEPQRQGGSSHSSNQSDSGDMIVKENSSTRFLFGPGHLTVSSSVFQRLNKFIFCATNHEYERYARSLIDDKPKDVSLPTEEAVQSLEEYVPTRAYQVTFLRPTVTILTADLPHADPSALRVIKKKKVPTATLR